MQGYMRCILIESNLSVKQPNIPNLSELGCVLVLVHFLHQNLKHSFKKLHDTETATL